MADEQTAGERDSGGQRRSGSKPWVIVILAVIIVVTMIQNSQEVHIDFLFADMSMSLFFALLLSTAIGFALGWLVARLRRRD